LKKEAAMRPWILVLAPTLFLSLSATVTLAAADPKIGKQLHDQRCAACHVKQMGGDGSEMYTRPEHRIKNLDALRQRVAFCVSQTNTAWFPEEQENVVAYLNAHYYKFK
jgi:mono/diheme cytochrome c family protein